MVQIPVYAFTGFLDSGKTKFIQETLEDPRFNAGERTLLLVFEEGEEEYDFSTYPHQNVYMEVLDQQTVTTKELQALSKKYKAQRVVAELNGMQLVGDLYTRFPEGWAVAQEVMFADSTTFMTYNANMRNLVMDKLVGAQMVVFNRLKPGEDTMHLHKLVRAANRKMDILYDYLDGTTAFDEIEECIPRENNLYDEIEIKELAKSIQQLTQRAGAAKDAMMDVERSIKAAASDTAAAFLYNSHKKGNKNLKTS